MLEGKSQLEDLLGCDRLRGIPWQWVEEGEIPRPYRQLLCHHKDMTSTLAAFHGGEVALKVFHSKRNGDQYLREVLLSVDGKPVEYGVIVMSLDHFPPDLQERILGENEPLGKILNTSGLPYQSSPRGNLEFPEVECFSDIFPSAGSGSLYGRYNALLDSEGRFLARILEILPREKS
ncbi:hypothetical protein V2O64_09460 [Verrucomicrobiaceae bacterium 227]